MIYTEQEIRLGDVKTTRRRLRQLAKDWQLDCPLVQHPELNRQADLISNQLIALEDWLAALETNEAVEVPEGRFHSVQEASKYTGVQEGTIYYRLESQPDTHYKLNPSAAT